MSTAFVVRDDLQIQGKPPATKRQALGTITNINTRVQPHRAAKQVRKTDLDLFQNA